MSRGDQGENKREEEKKKKEFLLTSHSAHLFHARLVDTTTSRPPSNILFKGYWTEVFRLFLMVLRTFLEDKKIVLKI
jgi:hypothetical protein